MNAVTRILTMQLGITLLAGLVAWALKGTVAGYSAVLGGLICVIPSTFLGMRMMAVRHSNNPQKMLNAAYLGEAGKWFLSFGFFALVYIWIKPLHPVSLLMGFIAAQGGVWAAILTDKRALTD